MMELYFQADLNFNSTSITNYATKVTGRVPESPADAQQILIAIMNMVLL